MFGKLFGRPKPRKVIEHLPNGRAWGQNFQGPYHSCTVGKHILKLAARKNLSGVGITKLNKLTYFAHGWLLGLTDGRRKLVDEFAKTWDIGPIFPILYNVLNKLRREDARVPALSAMLEVLAEEPDLDENSAEAILLDYICDLYGEFSTTDLVEKSYKFGSPWSIACSHGSQIVENKVIADYYATSIRRVYG